MTSMLQVTRLLQNPLGQPAPEGVEGDIVRVSDGIATRRWRVGCRPTCAGATRTPAIPTSSPPNVENGPGSAANAHQGWGRPRAA
jgi:hypothetical protein